MRDTMDSIRIQSRYIIASPRDILHCGQVVVQRGRICEVTESTTQPADVDFGNAVLLPGFVNCHTHLEFSHFNEPLSAGASFPEWIGAVVRHRRQKASQQSETEQAQVLRSALVQGARECFATGTCLIADIVTPPWALTSVPRPDEFRTVASANNNTRRFSNGIPPLSPRDWEQHLGPVSFPRIIACPELLGLDEPRFLQSLHWARKLRATDLAQVSPVLSGFGISPHAPYSLWSNGFKSLFAEPAMPLSLAVMHIAESLDEREWASTGTGAFRAAFDRLGVPMPHERVQMDEAIRLLQSTERGLLVHGNYLSEQEMVTIAESPSLSVVFCPRTHEHFEHSQYPLESLLQKGINVVLGTDSRASNPDLNLWLELQSARRKYPSLSAAAGLASITNGAARALGWQAELGTLAVGKLAYINVLDAGHALNPENLLDEITKPGDKANGETQITPLAFALKFENIA